MSGNDVADEFNPTVFITDILLMKFCIFANLARDPLTIFYIHISQDDRRAFFGKKAGVRFPLTPSRRQL